MDQNPPGSELSVGEFIDMEDVCDSREDSSCDNFNPFLKASTGGSGQVVKSQRKTVPIISKPRKVTQKSEKDS